MTANKSCQGRALVLLFVFAFLLTSCGPISISTQPPVGIDDGQSAVAAWVRGLDGLTPVQQAARAEQVWNDYSQPPAVRERAAYILSTRPSTLTVAAQQYLSGAYQQAQTNQKMDMERLLTADLNTADNETLRSLAQSAPWGMEKRFPWNLTLWQAARRGLLDDNQAVLASVGDPLLYADPSVIGMAGAGGSIGAGTPVYYSGKTALILPLSGSFGSVGNQIANGARVAVQNLARQGVHMDLSIIDTQNPGWLEQAAMLPADCVVVGGPLQASDYNQLKARNVLQSRVLFSLTASLPDIDEGNLAWRFFTSPQDQINAVLDFTAGQLRMSSYGVFYPEDAYGRGMYSLFSTTATQRGLTVSGSSYPVDQIGKWTGLVGSFVQATNPGRGQVPTARAGFQAVFVPDSWKNMDMLVSSFQYHGAQKMVIMGTSLLEQSLVTASGLNADTFSRTIFPGVWNNDSSNPAALALKNGMRDLRGTANDWSVLGFDFVQFAAALGLDRHPGSAMAVNTRLRSGVNVDWAGAPMTWDGTGKGQRRLFLFQPAQSGMIALQPQAFSSYLAGTTRSLPNAPDLNADTATPASSGAGLDTLINAILNPVL